MTAWNLSWYSHSISAYQAVKNNRYSKVLIPAVGISTYIMLCKPTFARAMFVDVIPLTLVALAWGIGSLIPPIGAKLEEWIISEMITGVKHDAGARIVPPASLSSAIGFADMARHKMARAWNEIEENETIPNSNLHELDGRVVTLHELVPANTNKYTCLAFGSIS